MILNPCKFCGGTIELEKQLDGETWCASCLGCGACAEIKGTKEDIIEHCNNNSLGLECLD